MDGFQSMLNHFPGLLKHYSKNIMIICSSFSSRKKRFYTEFIEHIFDSELVLALIYENL